LLSMELDALMDHHPHTDAVSCMHRDPNDGRRVVQPMSNQCGKELPLCNACFFHNLLSHCLIPNSISLAVSIRIIQSSGNQYICVTQSFFDREGIRGPPLS
jgi:hypothetical protein